MGDVVSLGGQTKLDVPPEKVLRGAIEAKLTEVVIVGIDENGKRYFATSMAYGPDTLWNLQRAIHRLMQVADEG